MIDGLIGLIIVIVIVGIVFWLVAYLLDMVPMDARFKQIAKVLLILVAILIILSRALPMLGVNVL